MAPQPQACRRRAGGSSDDPICVAGAPFSVLDYDSVRRHARAIASAVQRRAMPPWLPEPGHGVFADERRLRDDQIALIAKWVESGAPEGNPADVPKPPTFSGGWQLGTPDLVLTLPEPYVLQPGSRDVFRNFVIPVPITTTRYVRAVEFRADRPQVLHHADLAIDLGRVSRVLDRAEPGPGFATMDGGQVQNVYGWSPGKVPVMEPADNAWTLDPGTDFVLLLHMIAGATSETVQPTIGLFFSDTPPTRTPISVKLEAQGDRHSRRRRELRRGGQLRAPGRRRGGERLSARALPREGDARYGDASRRFAAGSAVDSPVGLSLAGPVSLSIAAVPPAGHAAVDAVHLRQLRGESEQPHPSAAARAIGTALDRRDGPALARGRAAPRGGRGAPQRRFRPSLTARRHRVGRAGRPARSARRRRAQHARDAGICRWDAWPTRRRSSKRRCVWIPATRRRTATSGRCCRRRGGSPRGCSTCARPCG